VSQGTVDVAGLAPGASSVARRQRSPVRKVAASKVSKAVAQSKGRRASISGVEGDRDIPEEVASGGRTDVTTMKDEEAA
jgi:hypothetical protein